MLAELRDSIGNDVMVGLAQAVGAIALCAVVVLLCRWQSVRVEREAAISLIRGLMTPLYRLRIVDRHAPSIEKVASYLVLSNNVAQRCSFQVVGCCVLIISRIRFVIFV